jgi:molybdopterin molybdotransferase
VSVTRLSPAEASAHVLAGVAPLGSETVALREALGRVLARDVESPVSLPPWDNASMDGFAVRADDVRGASASRPVRLRVVATIAAGTRSTRALEPGTAIRIMTGAPVPEGADSVIRVEDTSTADDVVDIRDDRDASSNIRVAGEDVRAGVVVMRAGTTLGAAQIGVMSSVGCARPQVHRRPRVAILATGDELVPVESWGAGRAGRPHGEWVT